jgi:CRP-like cAMP-binding protein
MKQISLIGNWSNCFGLMQALVKKGMVVSFMPEQSENFAAFDLVIARISTEQDLEKLHDIACPWLAWCVSENKDLVNKAYGKGALSVFSEETPEEIIFQVIQRNLERLSHLPKKSPETVIQRKYQRGDIILLETDTVLEIQQGIIAQTMVHQDGTEVLLGLCGPQQMVVPHPADTCFIQLVSHTDSLVCIQSWERAHKQTGFSIKLRARLRQMEAWAAMQARPHLDQRVMGILSLLAEQFGVMVPEGRMVDVRITHTQLASAVGATRTTITRMIGDLRKQEILSLVETADGERYCLTQWEQNQHELQVSMIDDKNE